MYILLGHKTKETDSSDQRVTTVIPPDSFSLKELLPTIESLINHRQDIELQWVESDNENVANIIVEEYNIVTPRPENWEGLE